MPATSVVPALRLIAATLPRAPGLSRARVASTRALLAFARSCRARPPVARRASVRCWLAVERQSQLTQRVANDRAAPCGEGVRRAALLGTGPACEPGWPISPGVADGLAAGRARSRTYGSWQPVIATASAIASAGSGIPWVMG